MAWTGKTAFNQILGDEEGALLRGGWRCPLWRSLIISLVKVDPERVAADIRIFLQKCTLSSSP